MSWFKHGTHLSRRFRRTVPSTPDELQRDVTVVARWRLRTPAAQRRVRTGTQLRRLLAKRRPGA